MAFHDFEIFTLSDSTPFRTLVVTEPMGYLCFEEESVFSPRAKFAIERARNGSVHIRSCYNNKYWTRDSSNNVMAIADEPVEDELSGRNTLFRPSFEANNTVRFSRVPTGTVGMRPPEHMLRWCLTVSSQQVIPALANYFDPASKIKLPTRVAFKGGVGDGNRYLATESKTQWNSFRENDYRSLGANYIIHHTNNGDIRVKNMQANKWWTTDRNIIKSSFGGDVSDTNPNILFEVIKIDGNEIVLRYRGNNRFCIDQFVMYVADSITDSRAGYMKVVEPLISRNVTVHNPDFKLETVRIYNHSQDRILAFTDVVNGGSTDLVIEKTLSQQVTRTKAWRKSQSLMLGTSMTFSSGIPKLGIGLEITFEGQFTKEYEWSQSEETTDLISETVTVTVPPGKTTRILLMASSASFDIPFSYTQTDRYVTGEAPVTTVLDDGVFSGSNVYYFYIKTEETLL
ncbi:uncharacterized protein LOC141595668 [Silene latifolia]|uniref:uncharacterized protein LOC141595668 n=1 Tax=Silene latifolia TaxID=37657 RepID=UPI003D784E66